MEELEKYSSGFDQFWSEPDFLFSFDLFDTLVTRRCILPNHIFYFCGVQALRKRLVSISAEQFRLLRIASEEQARRTVNAVEPSLAEIYKIFTSSLCLPLTFNHKLCDIELEVERSMLYLVEPNYNIFQHHDQASRIVLTDMYLGRSEIYSIVPELLRNEKVFSSRDINLSKFNKTSYSELARVRSGREIAHYGNDLVIDIVNARQFGIKAYHLPICNPNSFEVSLSNWIEKTGGLSSVLAGLSRKLRIEYSKSGTNLFSDRAIFFVGVALPVLSMFTIWTLRKAESVGIKKLYFISRDGYVSLKIAESIRDKYFKHIEVEYFYGSRQSWHLPTIFSLSDIKNANWLFGISDGEDLLTFLGRIALDQKSLGQNFEILQQLWKRSGSSSATFKSVFLDFLDCNPGVLELILEAAALARANVFDYFDRICLSAGDDIGFVEIGWSGRTRASLLKLARAYFGFEPGWSWHYFGGDNGFNEEGEGRRSFFLYGPGIGRPEIPFAPVLIESFCLAPHGSVIGFEDGYPTFRFFGEKELNDNGRGDFLGFLGSFGEDLSTLLEFCSVGTYDECVYFILNSVCLNPDPKYAMAWSQMPFDFDQASRRALPLADKPVLARRVLRDALIYGDLGFAFRQRPGNWGSATARMSYLGSTLVKIAAFFGILRKSRPMKMTCHLLSRISFIKAIFNSLKSKKY